MKNIFFSFILLLFLTSCQFHNIETPGAQISWSVAEAKKNNTFICGYKLPGNKINGIKIETIFAEKKYSSDGGYFSKYQIDSINSQLVIVAKDYMAKDGLGLGVNWNISGFNPYSGKITYRNYNFKSFPDSIPIIITAITGKDSTKVVEKLTLYKIHG
jgi:hypothetical protein